MKDYAIRVTTVGLKPEGIQPYFCPLMNDINQYNIKFFFFSSENNKKIPPGMPYQKLCFLLIYSEFLEKQSDISAFSLIKAGTNGFDLLSMYNLV